MYNYNTNCTNIYSVDLMRLSFSDEWNELLLFRFGSFEIFKTIDPMTGRKGPSVGRVDILKTLINYVISTFYPQVNSLSYIRYILPSIVHLFTDRRTVQITRWRKIRSIFRRNCQTNSITRCSMAMCWLVSWSFKYGQYVDRWRNNRLWSVRIHGSLWSEFYLQWFRWQWPIFV